MRHILIIGATRGTGRLIASLLAHRGERVRVLARDVTRATGLFGEAVEVVGGDITQPRSLPPVMSGVTDIVFTAGVRSGRPAAEGRVKRTEYDGVVNVLTVARGAGLEGRFLYMTASGVGAPSLAATLLNLYKGNTLRWRRRVEDEIRGSGLDYTIIRAGILLDAAGGRRALEVTQRDLPLSLRYRISRADVAEVFVAALDHPRASRATFDVVWGRGPRRDDVARLLDRLQPDGHGRLRRSVAFSGSAMERSKGTEERRELLNRLIRYERPIEPVLEGLAGFRFDSTEELVCLQRSDLVTVLDRFLAGELTADEVTDWADQLEVRDDVGLEPGFEDRLRDAIFSLANPNLREPLTHELAERLRAQFGPSRG